MIVWSQIAAAVVAWIQRPQVVDSCLLLFMDKALQYLVFHPVPECSSEGTLLLWGVTWKRYKEVLLPDWNTFQSWRGWNRIWEKLGLFLFFLFCQTAACFFFFQIHHKPVQTGTYWEFTLYVEMMELQSDRKWGGTSLEFVSLWTTSISLVHLRWDLSHWQLELQSARRFWLHSHKSLWLGDFCHSWGWISCWIVFDCFWNLVITAMIAYQLFSLNLQWSLQNMNRGPCGHFWLDCSSNATLLVKHTTFNIPCFWSPSQCKQNLAVSSQHNWS